MEHVKLFVKNQTGAYGWDSFFYEKNLAFVSNETLASMFFEAKTELGKKWKPSVYEAKFSFLDQSVKAKIVIEENKIAIVWS